MEPRAEQLTAYLSEVRGLVIDELKQMLPRNRFTPILYDLMLEYPLRAAKSLRPALCMATCRALGGRVEEVLRTAVVIELYHNAFLIHDDVEDGSLMRRGLPTLHREHGTPVAINVGDAMLALALRPLLDNTRRLGLGKALRILDLVARMAIESAEGQALELDWIRRGCWQLRDADYWHLVFKKTCWYTFIAPLLIAGVVTALDDIKLRQLRRFAIYLGVAFQIRDDLLNLTADESLYGKEVGGDLHEGKRTLILLHALRLASAAERAEALRILGKPVSERSGEDVAWLFGLIRDKDSLAHAQAVAERAAEKAAATLTLATPWMSSSRHRQFLEDLVAFVLERER
jgi:geranylgeranyl diphosphate synthase type II